MSCGDVIWRQQDEPDKSIEFTTAIIMPPGVKPRDLDVTVKDGEVICVKYKESSLLQWRLAQPVESENVVWSVSDGKITIELQKQRADSWQQLVNWPVPPTDKVIMSKDDLDRLVLEELPSLPPEKSDKDVSTTEDGAENPNEPGNSDDDLDKMLDEAESELHPLVQMELKGNEEEQKELVEKHAEYTEALKTETDEEKRSELERKLEVIDHMEVLNKEMRYLRSQPSSMDIYFKLQALDVKKGRCNAGDLTDGETEQFSNDEEQAMSGIELVRNGLGCIQGEDAAQFKQGLHFLRLAAIHHNMSGASIVLFRLYNQLQNPAKAAWFLLRRANMDDCDPMTNSLVAELHEKGMRMFAPLMGLAVHYHQRAAMSGSTNSMMSLANIFHRGCTTNTMSDEKTQLKHVDMDRFRRWLKLAEDRASPSAFFALCHLHMSGEADFDKSYTKAKSFLQRAVAAMPELSKVVPSMEAKLNEMRIAEGLPASPSSPASPAVGSGGGALTTNNAKRSDAAEKLRRLQEQGAGGARSNMEAPGSPKDAGKMARSAANRKFWERTVSTGVMCFSIYTLAFPLRVMALPYFYMAVQYLKDMFLGSLLSSGRGASGRNSALF